MVKLESTGNEIIMLIDDDEIDLFISGKVLELSEVGGEYLFFTSTHKALNYLRNNPLEKLPHIIFLDINMPLLNGFGFLSHFMDLPDNIKNKCKIVVLTSSNNMKDVLIMENNPLVICYLNKPLNNSDLARLFNLQNPQT